MGKNDKEPWKDPGTRKLQTIVEQSMRLLGVRWRDTYKWNISILAIHRMSSLISVKIRNPFSAFCHDLDTHEEKSSGACDKIWRGDKRKFPQNMSIFQTKKSNHNSIHTSCTREPEETPPYMRHTPLLKPVSAICQIHHPGLNHRLGFWVKLPFTWWTTVSFCWWEQAGPEKPTNSFIVSEIKCFQQRHKRGIFPQELNGLPWLQN